MNAQYDDDDDDGDESSTSTQQFQGIQLSQNFETAAIAVAAAEKAAIEGRYILAMRNPRDWDTIEQKMKKECLRPGFAQTAIYRKPVGSKLNKKTQQWEEQFVEGLSIRFAETAIRYMTNFYASSKSIYDDSDKMIIRITVMDLESNATMEDDITVEKTVERRKLKKNQKPLGMRTNSYGDTVFIVPATDDQVLNKKNALISKSLRNGVLRLLPGDIQDVCEELCRKTASQKDASDPAAAKKNLFDAFAKIGILPDQLKEFLGHSNELSPKELSDLRGIYSAVSQGDTTWSAVMNTRNPVDKDDKEATAQAKKVQETLAKHTESAKKKADAKDAAKKGGEPTGGPEQPQSTTTPASTDRDPGQEG